MCYIFYPLQIVTAVKTHMINKRFDKFVFFFAVGFLFSSVSVQIAHGSALSVSFSGLPAGTMEDLTADGALDWAHWGLTTTNSFDHKNGVPNLIGNYSVVGLNPVQQTNDVGVGYSWSDGTPTASTANSTTALLVTGASNGFQFQVTTDTNLTRLLLFLGARGAQGKLLLHLSDSSATDFINSSLDIPAGETNGFYTIDFAAATTGQTLTVTFSLQTSYAAGAAVLLHAAAVQYGPFNFEPSVTLTNPPNDSILAWPATINLGADANDFDGSIREVQFFANETLVATKTNLPYTFAWMGAPPGAYTITAKATDNLGGTAVSEPATVFIYTNTGTLTASVAGSAGTLDLSAEGTSDWAHWGLLRESSYDHKFGVVPMIGNYAVVGYGAAYRFGDNPVSYSWSDGTPKTAVTNTATGVYVAGEGAGFEFSVPADTALRTLKLYVGAYAARGKLRLHLSDLSTPPVFDTTVDNSGSGPNSVYTIQYRSGAPEQALLVRFTVDTAYLYSGNVTLQAATLVTENVPPFCIITNIFPNAVFATPAHVTIKASASDSDGSVTNVSFFDGAALVGQDASPPYEFTWSNAPAGAHTLTASAADNLGKTFTSYPVNVFVTIGGGKLIGGRTTPSGTVDISAEGRTDWTHWGLLTAGSFNHRAGVAQKISGLTKIGTGPLQRLSDYAAGFSWTNGTPTASAVSSPTGVYIEGVDRGFQISAPADTLPRRLKVYVGAYASRGRLTASLSDASAPHFSDDGVDSVYGNVAGEYTLDYTAASSNQTLTVKFTALENYDVDYGNVTFEATALALMGAPLRNPQYASGIARFSFLTDPGINYLVQRSDILPATNWITIKTVLGNGALTNVLDAAASGPQNFYRVLTY